MVSPEEAVMRAGQELLARLRREDAAWACVEFDPEGEEGLTRTDLNMGRRRPLAWALQQEWQESDSELVRFALEEEVKWRREDPWQGIGETLEILAGLVARQRRVEDVWVLGRAKRANFDTACGFDVQHLLAAGVATTMAYVRESTHPERDAVLRWLLKNDGTPVLQESDVAAWLAKEPGSLPVEGAGRADVWFARALSLDMKDAARSFLDEWARSQQRDARMLGALARRLEQLESWRESSAVREECFQQLVEPFDKAGQACDIARVWRLAGEPREAVHWLGEAARLHAENAAWRELGLGRQFVEECFRCAASLGGGNGDEVFALAEKFARVTPRLPLVALQAAVEAAEAVDESRVAHYARLRDREERRIAKALAKAGIGGG